jgi:ribosomal protein S18 acetylase RimI-like enzyme
MIDLMVTLEPMKPEEFEVWQTASISGYAAEMVRNGAWAPEHALEQATDLFARLVPDGQSTLGHEFRSIVTDGREKVGALWFAAAEEIGHGTCFIWDIVIDEAHRGRGYGRGAMEALEPLARSLGYDAIRLHVFGDNAIARHLYQSVGYVETDVTMMKRIG